MFRHALFLLLLYGANAFSQDLHPHLSAEQKQHILDGEFTLIRNTQDIPQNVKAAFAAVTSEKEFQMADPGKSFQATDVVTRRSLPWRRLIFAETQNGKWLIFYEHGGIGISRNLLVFQVRPNGAADFIWGAGAGAAKDLDALRSMLGKGKLRDDLDYRW